MKLDSGVRYLINSRDQICFVDEAWHRFALAIDGAEVVGDAVISRPLWDFITDDSTRLLYQTLIERVRQGATARFTLRCDSPEFSRLLEMTMSQTDIPGYVEFTTQIVQQLDRTPVALLERGAPRSEELLKTCSWCNRIEVGPGEWSEPEDAINRLRLMESPILPRLTHGMCMPCFENMTSVVANLSPPKQTFRAPQ